MWIMRFSVFLTWLCIHRFCIDIDMYITIKNMNVIRRYLREGVTQRILHDKSKVVSVSLQYCNRRISETRTFAIISALIATYVVICPYFILVALYQWRIPICYVLTIEIMDENLKILFLETRRKKRNWTNHELLWTWKLSV